MTNYRVDNDIPLSTYPTPPLQVIISGDNTTANALMGIQVATNRLITAANEMRAEAAVEKARRPLPQPTTRPITPWRPNAREECSSPCNVAPKPKQGVPWKGTLPESHITRFPSGVQARQTTSL